MPNLSLSELDRLCELSENDLNIGTNYEDFADALIGWFFANHSALRELQKDAERLDWVERNLCRAGEVYDENRLTGIMKCWQIVTQLDESLRNTIDTLRASMTEGK